MIGEAAPQTRYRREKMVTFAFAPFLSWELLSIKKGPFRDPF